MADSPDYVVIAARRPVAVLARSILHDLTAQGLAKPVRIVDLDSLGERPEVPCIVLDADGSRPDALQQDLSRQRPGRMRLAVVGVVDDEESCVTQQQAVRVLDAVQGTMTSAPVTLLSVTAGAPGAQWQARSLVMLGWHNLAVSPEQSRAPGAPSVALQHSPSDPRWAMLVVGTLTGLLGLWPGQRQGPFDDRQPPSGPLITPLRAFSRSLSSGAVQEALGERLITVSERYPTPRFDAGFAVTVDDEVSRAVDMGEALLNKYADTAWPRKRVPTPAPKPQDVGLGKALSGFLGFVGDSLRRAPSRLAAAVDREASRFAAKTAQQAIFGGSDSGYAVVVRGVRADGSFASWAEYEDSIESVIRRSTGSSNELPAVERRPQLWHDFVGAGLTLLDAGNRDPELGPWTQGTQRAIIPTTDRVAPDPRGTFTLPASLAAFLPGWEIAPGDDIAVGRLFDRFDHLMRTQPHLGPVISGERNRLRTWAEEARRSYAGHVGRRIGDGHRAVIAEVGELNDKVDRLLQRPRETRDVRGLEDELGTKVAVMSAVSASIAVILVVLTVLGALPWWGLLLGLVGVAAGWMTGGAIIHVKAQARVYAVLHAMHRANTELEDALRHRMEALEDLRRISQVYRQYLDWSRVLGAFVHAPHGNAQHSDQREVHVGQGLPLNIAIGVADTDQEAVDEVAHRWRGDLFPVGWLSEPWREFVESRPPELGALRHQLVNDDSLLARDPLIDGEYALSHWSRVMAEHAATRGMEGRFRDAIVRLTMSDAPARERLLGRVVVRDAATGHRQVGTREAFVAGLDAAAGERDVFQPGMFASDATVLDVRSVKEAVRQDESQGLDDALIVMQVGRALTVDQLAGTHVAVAQVATPSDDQDFV